MSQYLYRFIRPHGGIQRYSKRLKQLLVKNCCIFSSPLEVNDPFDCQTLFSVTDARASDLSEFLQNTLVRYRLIDDQTLIELAMEKAKQDLPGWIAHLRLRYSEFQADLLKTVGMLCLFEAPNDTPDDILMWSYYADGHKGYCLQFAKGLLMDEFICKQVEYGENYPTLKEIATAEGSELTELLLCRKSIRWRHEREWRIWCDRNSTDNIIVTLPENALTGVVFGCRAEDRDKEEIKNWASHRVGLPSLRFFQAKMHPDKYQIIIEQATTPRI